MAQNTPPVPQTARQCDSTGCTHRLRFREHRYCEQCYRDAAAYEAMTSPMPYEQAKRYTAH